MDMILEFVRKTNKEMTEEKLRELLKNSEGYLTTSLAITVYSYGLGIDTRGYGLKNRENLENYF